MKYSIGSINKDVILWENKENYGFLIDVPYLDKYGFIYDRKTHGRDYIATITEVDKDSILITNIFCCVSSDT